MAYLPDQAMAVYGTWAQAFGSFRSNPKTPRPHYLAGFRSKRLHT